MQRMMSTNYQRTASVDHTLNQQNHSEGVRFRGSKRLIERGETFNQCTGKISLRKRINLNDWRALYGSDWFHSLVDAPTSRIVIILLSAYVGIIAIFAVVFYLVAVTFGCNLGFDSMLEAFAFSLETMATVGYGTMDIFFADCTLAIMLLTAQVCVKLIVDAVTIGIIYCRLARPHARASTVLFSNRMVIRRIRGKLYAMFQLCELRKHQLVEAHVRLYCIRNEVDPSMLTLNSQMETPAQLQENEQQQRNQSDASSNAPVRDRTTSLPRLKLPRSESKHAIMGETAHKVTATNCNAAALEEGTAGSISPSGALSPMQRGTAGDLENKRLFRAKSAYGSFLNFVGLGDREKNSEEEGGKSCTVGTKTAGSFTWSNPFQHAKHYMSLPQQDDGEVRPLSTFGPASYMQTCAMRLNHPNDELGGMILLMTPQVVVHEIDASSPIMPPPLWYCNFSYEGEEYVRWNPPSFRHFIQMTQPIPQSMSNPPSNQQQQQEQQHDQHNEQEKQKLDSATPHTRPRSGTFTKMHRLTSMRFGAHGHHHGHHHHHHHHGHHRTHRYNMPHNSLKSAHHGIRVAHHHHHGGGGKGVSKGSSSNNLKHLGEDNSDSSQQRRNSNHKHQYQQTTITPAAAAAAAPLIFYDAEALGRMEFPSVSRRVEGESNPSALPPGYAAQLQMQMNYQAAHSIAGSTPTVADLAASAPSLQRFKSCLHNIPQSSTHASSDESSPRASSAPSKRRENDTLHISSSASASNDYDEYVDIMVSSDSDETTSTTNRSRSKSHSRSSMRLNLSATLSGSAEPHQPAAVEQRGIQLVGQQSFLDKKADTHKKRRKSAGATTTNGSAGLPIRRHSQPRLPPPSPSTSPRAADASAPKSQQEQPLELSLPSDSVGIAGAGAETPNYRPNINAMSSAFQLQSTGLASFAEFMNDPKRLSAPAAPTPPATPNTQGQSPVPGGGILRNSSIGDLRRKHLLAGADGKKVDSTGNLSTFSTDDNDVDYVKKRSTPFTRQHAVKFSPSVGNDGTKADDRNHHQQQEQLPQQPHHQSPPPQQQDTQQQFQQMYQQYQQKYFEEYGEFDWQHEERQMVQRYMRDRQMEIIAIVEGVDAATGGIVQARHSYTCDEIEWDKSFQFCVFKDPEDGCTTIDFSLFHELYDVPKDSSYAGPIPSCL